MSSLSIDPKLFASIEKDEKADEEILETAKLRELTRTEVPPVVSESSKEKVENCKKKVSHARKVCLFLASVMAKGLNPSIANCRPYS